MCTHVLELIHHLARDNGLAVKEWITWPTNIDVLEEQASRLTPLEKETLATGEHLEVIRLVETRKIGDLDRFLEAAFDGDLHNAFFKYHPQRYYELLEEFESYDPDEEEDWDEDEDEGEEWKNA